MEEPMREDSSSRLSDPVHRADKLFIGLDRPPGHQIEDEGNGREDGRPRGPELNRAPGLVGNRLTYNEITDIPTYYQQRIEETEECLHLTVVIYKYGIGGNDCRWKEHSHQGPGVEMTVADGIGKPEIIDTGHFQSCCLEGTYLHTKTNDGHNNGRQEI